MKRRPGNGGCCVCTKTVDYAKYFNLYPYVIIARQVAYGILYSCFNIVRSVDRRWIDFFAHRQVINKNKIIIEIDEMKIKN